MANELPSPCRQVTGFVAQLDCLQDQQDLLSRVLQIEQTRTEIEALRIEQEALTAPPPILEEVIVSASEDDESSIVAEQIAWFDQQLEVYAVIGSGEQMTAYARLDGREYRLQEGDSLRLARVVTVHPRGIELEVYGHSIEVGLGGRPPVIAEADPTDGE